MKKDIVIIGAGLTGLTTGFSLKNKDIAILERADRTGGQIRSYKKDGFLYESGPNTGMVTSPEVVELLQRLHLEDKIEYADEKCKHRLIWKDTQFETLPENLKQAITTPLFTTWDKLRILGEPFRKKGNNPHESVGALTARRLGQSYLNYAVNPFLSGIYAGDPMKLATKFALPKLYALEQNYGSFILGSIAKAFHKKTEEEKTVSKKIFSFKGGLSDLTEELTKQIGSENIILSAKNVSITPNLPKRANETIATNVSVTANTSTKPNENYRWKVKYNSPDGEEIIYAKTVITTSGAYTLPDLLPFIEKDDVNILNNLKYAPVVQVAVGFNNVENAKSAIKNMNSFGGLIPSCENRNILGVLFPSSYFENRAPQKGATLSFFIGGINHKELIKLSDEELKTLIESDLVSMVKFPKGTEMDMIDIFRHEKAIPQYESNSEERLAMIEKIQNSYPGLIIGGNIRDGIGVAHRITQGVKIAKSL